MQTTFTDNSVKFNPIYFLPDNNISKSMKLNPIVKGIFILSFPRGIFVCGNFSRLTLYSSLHIDVFSEDFFDFVLPSKFIKTHVKVNKHNGLTEINLFFHHSSYYSEFIENLNSNMLDYLSDVSLDNPEVIDEMFYDDSYDLSLNYLDDINIRRLSLRLNGVRISEDQAKFTLWDGVNISFSQKFPRSWILNGRGDVMLPLIDDPYGIVPIDQKFINLEKDGGWSIVYDNEWRFDKYQIPLDKNQKKIKEFDVFKFTNRN